ncbi:Cap-Gly-containing protein [Venustampulla echinocandica]|uniref:Cap-Gly-containing protein n=1 Tax=Venustampulla echinocandica TaxID=2656787 RepID=A0A370TSM5_9HELO|nr:Cap-Gly-containing protein [Venustampulla echinocandica]RDL38503.1 Cap-Gly-containing protein [Venustampulla echinocandica]
MAMQTAGDIPLLIASENSSSERRITPSWTIGQLKAKLEPVTGIPPLSQRLVLKLGGQQSTPIEAADEENTQLSAFPLAPYAEILVTDIRPPGLRPNYNDASKVEKYTLPTAIYETKTDSVLAWKKANKLGRFDPAAPSIIEARLASYAKDISDRGIEVGKRCRVGGDDTRRGAVMYVGEVEEIAKETGDGGLGQWVGVKFDEPVGKNDGSLGGKRYWGKEGDGKFGVFVRPERVEVGEFPMLDDLEDMEEI